MPIRLEDDAVDVWKKALRGLQKTPRDLAAASGLPLEQVRKVTRGLPDAGGIHQLAPLLDLDPSAVLALSEERAAPPEITAQGLVTLTTPFPVPSYPEMTVNSYLLLPPDSSEAVLFDAGAAADPVLEAVRQANRSVSAVFLTHAHRDHVAALPDLLEALNHPPVYLHRAESHPDAQPFDHGASFSMAGLTIEARLTDGHSPGGTSFLVSGMPNRLAIVGDALFARSIGGCPPEAYRHALANNRLHLLSLPPETVLCPGHGPLTTVAEEIRHNPFFARNG